MANKNVNSDSGNQTVFQLNLNRNCQLVLWRLLIHGFYDYIVTWAGYWPVIKVKTLIFQYTTSLLILVVLYYHLEAQVRLSYYRGIPVRPIEIVLVLLCTSYIYNHQYNSSRISTKLFHISETCSLFCATWTLAWVPEKRFLFMLIIQSIMITWVSVLNEGDPSPTFKGAYM